MSYPLVPLSTVVNSWTITGFCGSRITRVINC